jgi:predicted anti-sigma-YlaC factor YlaD
MLDCQKIGEMLSGYMDRELTQSDRQRVELHLQSCSECRTTFQEMTGLRQAVGELSFGEMTREQWGRIMNDLTVRASRGIGWLFLALGLVFLLGYAAYSFAVDDTVGALTKTGVSGLALGMTFLFFSVVRQRFIAYKTDRYKDVEI